jgi:hypothetical protein
MQKSCHRRSNGEAPHLQCGTGFFRRRICKEVGEPGRAFER